jgi:hypothetical protein
LKVISEIFLFSFVVCTQTVCIFLEILWRNIMSNKTRGSGKMMFTCDKNGKRSLADFENVEEALQASGGYQPDPNYIGPFRPWFPRVPGFPMGEPGISLERLGAIKLQALGQR